MEKDGERNQKLFLRNVAKKEDKKWGAKKSRRTKRREGSNGYIEVQKDNFDELLNVDCKTNMIRWIEDIQVQKEEMKGKLTEEVTEVENMRNAIADVICYIASKWCAKLDRTNKTVYTWIRGTLSDTRKEQRDTDCT